MTTKIRLALHGGAGDAASGADTQAHRAALREIATEAHALLTAGKSALDVVETAVMRLEDCPLFNAGVDEKAKGVVQIKDLVEGKRVAAGIADHAAYREERAGQVEVSETELVEAVKRMLGRR